MKVCRSVYFVKQIAVESVLWNAMTVITTFLVFFYHPKPLKIFLKTCLLTVYMLYEVVQI